MGDLHAAFGAHGFMGGQQNPQPGGRDVAQLAEIQGKAFRTAQAKNPSMSDAVEESEITQIDFFPDTGAVPQQMTAFEINMAVVTENPLDN